MPPCYFESITTVLFNHSPYFVEITSLRSVFLITLIVSILSAGKKTWQHARAQERSSRIHPPPPVMLLMSDFFLKVTGCGVQRTPLSRGARDPERGRDLPMGTGSSWGREVGSPEAQSHFSPHREVPSGINDTSGTRRATVQPELPTCCLLWPCPAPSPFRVPPESQRLSRRPRSPTP